MSREAWVLIDWSWKGRGDGGARKERSTLPWRSPPVQFEAVPILWMRTGLHRGTLFLSLVYILRYLFRAFTYYTCTVVLYCLFFF